MFREYITQRTKEKFEADSYEGNEATYLGMKTPMANDGDFEGAVLDSDKYENEINQIEIPHERTMEPGEILTEKEQTTLRSELGKLIWIALIARPGAIYDASASAQTSPTGEMMDFRKKKVRFLKTNRRFS